MGITVNALINDAGQEEWRKFTETDLQRDLDIIQLNIGSLLALTKYFLRDMVARNEGRVLQVASEAGKSPMPLLSVYAAFVISFSTALANELKDTNITITLLMPGASDTDFFHEAHMQDTVTYREEELSPPEEVAKDGYEALMKGENRIISGGKTKRHVWMANLMSDSSAAASNRKLMEASDKDEQEGRTQSGHQPSRIEREAIKEKTGQSADDYPKEKIVKP